MNLWKAHKGKDANVENFVNLLESKTGTAQIVEDIKLILRKTEQGNKMFST